MLGDVPLIRLASAETGRIWRGWDVNLTNESYVIVMGTKNFTERYYRDRVGWLKVSARGRTSRMSAEQVLNHLLPALAGVHAKMAVLRVEHHENG